MRSYRLEQKVKMLTNQHFDIWLYKSRAYIVFILFMKLKCSLCKYRFLHRCICSITKTNSGHLI